MIMTTNGFAINRFTKPLIVKDNSLDMAVFVVENGLDPHTRRRLTVRFARGVRHRRSGRRLRGLCGRRKRVLRNELRTSTFVLTNTLTMKPLRVTTNADKPFFHFALVDSLIKRVLRNDLPS